MLNFEGDKFEFSGQMARVSERNLGAPERAQEHRQGQASNASAAPVKNKKTNGAQGTCGDRLPRRSEGDEADSTPRACFCVSKLR